MGSVDILEENNIECLGPKKILALLVATSKLFCRNFLSILEKKYNLVLNPKYMNLKQK